MNKEQITFDGIPIPLTTETLLDAMEKAYPNSVPFFGAFADDAKRERQYHAFRARILRLDAEKDEQIEFLNKVVDYSNKTSKEKDTRIAEMEEQLAGWRDWYTKLLPEGDIT